MIPRLIILFILISGLLISCEEYSNYQIIIENNSLDTIEIVYMGTTAYTNGIDSIFAMPGERTIYYDAEGRRIKSKNFECDPQISKDEVKITSSSNRLIIKDISDKENWECETDAKNTYRRLIFQLNETDLN